MSFSADTTPLEDSDTASLYTTSEESEEDLGAALSKIFGFRCQPEFAVKAKKRSARPKFCHQLGSIHSTTGKVLACVIP